MTPYELEEYFKYPEKFMMITKNMEGGPFVVQHHHTRYGFYAPSGVDFYSIMSQTWTNHSVILSQKEIWIIETKGTFNINERENVCQILMSRAELAKKFAKSKGYEKHSKEWWNEANAFYSRDVENFINNMNQNNIKVYRVDI